PLAAPVCREFEWIDPLHAFRAARDRPGLVFLDSGCPAGPLSRWSALAAWPLEVVELRVGDGLLAGPSPRDPFERLSALYGRWSDRCSTGAGRGDPGRSPERHA